MVGSTGKLVSCVLRASMAALTRVFSAPGHGSGAVASTVAKNTKSSTALIRGTLRGYGVLDKSNNGERSRCVAPAPQRGSRIL